MRMKRLMKRETRNAPNVRNAHPRPWRWRVLYLYTLILTLLLEDYPLPGSKRKDRKRSSLSKDMVRFDKPCTRITGAMGYFSEHMAKQDYLTEGGQAELTW